MACKLHFESRSLTQILVQLSVFCMQGDNEENFETNKQVTAAYNFNTGPQRRKYESK